MKYMTIALLTLIISFNVLAEKIKSKVDSLDIGIDGEVHLVKLTNGRVAFIPFNDKFLLKKIQEHHKKGEWLELVLDQASALKTIKVIPPQPSNEDFTNYTPMTDPYVPSVVSTTKAHNMFIKMRRDYKDKSQCFNRAHIWTYEEYMRSKTNFNKVFLFFTSSYIRAYNFHWWFHVTPMLYVGGTKKANWRILDRRYTSGIRTSKTWTDIFIKSKRTCKIVNKYADYRENQRSQHCYMIPVPMYYLVPSDIERRDSTGEERTTYEDLDVQHAYWEAFKNMPTP